MVKKAKLISVLSALGLVACGEQADLPQAPTETDPLVARALHDPLMVDPDLAYRNEANAALTIGFDHALPPLEATDAAARRAREEARLVLLEGGRIDQLPDMIALERGRTLSDARGDAIGMSAVYNIPVACTDQLIEDLNWAADMPVIAEVMPHGMVHQAAGSGACDTRIISYRTPAPPEDVMEWHFNLAQRANLNIDLHAEPEMAMWAEKRGTNAVVHTSKLASGMTAVDILHWVE